MKRRTCYMCSSQATSVEHAPPKCLFPSASESEDGIDRRLNLVTVPSCRSHNSEKSNEDEYLLQVLSASITSNSIGFSQFTSKVKRSFESAPAKASNLIARSRPATLRRVEDAEWEQGLQVIVEDQRLDEALCNCARALYFKRTRKKFQGQAQAITAFTMYSDASTQAMVDKSVSATILYFEKHNVIGTNPDVFWYKFEEGDRNAFFLMCFYGKSIALVRFKKIQISR